ncbi:MULTISPECIES: GNAT family N-acetyltransferase [Bacillus]|uniref:GNAT family N-acetyltransferase n=1 Tax=Bacillus TaxID=1386 RepID=UPI0002DBF342|nr:MULTISPECIES: hypothetical protein [Bacillus]
MLIVRKGEEIDYPVIKEFISKSEASYIEKSLFVMVENMQKKLVGVVGIQTFSDIGLLRSLVLSRHFPAEKLPILIEKVLLLARESQCQFLYLATNKEKSIPLFQAFGFSRIETELLPEALKLSTDLVQFAQKKEVTFMWKTL